MRTMASRWGFRQWDDRIGDGIEAVLKRHHRRRLDKLGWLDALEPPRDDDWWSERTPVRSGNDLEVLVDGGHALPVMEQAIKSATRSVHIANWHASPDFCLTRGPDSKSLRDLLAEMAEKVDVRLLMWAGPPVPAFQPTRKVVREAKAEFERDSRVRCALDSRERTMHCHHEKIMIIDDELAFVGGIDFTALEGDRYDDSDHRPRQALRWHDVAVQLRGPVVADVAQHFNDRWREIAEETLPTPTPPEPAGELDVQMVRTVPEKTYDFLPRGEFTILQAYVRALRAAEHFIYLENQFLWSPEIVDVLADKLEHPPTDDFRVLLLLPTKPSNGRDTTRGQLGRLVDVDGDSNRLLATTVIGHPGEEAAPVYVHAKVGIVDDRWLTIGSGNLNEHSLFNDSELNVVACDETLARETRLRLWAEHTERPIEEIGGEPCQVIDEIWRPIAEEQEKRRNDGLTYTHRLTMLPHISRRVDRLEGPVRGLLVDG